MSLSRATAPGGSEEPKRDPVESRQAPTLEFIWDHCPDRGATEILVPTAIFPPGSSLTVQPAEVACSLDPNRQVLVCHASRTMTIVLRLIGPR